MEHQPGSARGAPAVDPALTAFLATRHPPCPECGYDLHGVESAACPECGTAVVLRGSVARAGAAGSDITALTEYLRDRDASCLACGAAIEITDASNCRACGNPVRISDLRQAALSGTDTRLAVLIGAVTLILVFGCVFVIWQII